MRNFIYKNRSYIAYDVFSILLYLTWVKLDDLFILLQTLVYVMFLYLD